MLWKVTVVDTRTRTYWIEAESEDDALSRANGNPPDRSGGARIVERQTGRMKRKRMHVEAASPTAVAFLDAAGADK